MNNIITENQWADWRMNPVTQAFMEYVRNKKHETVREKFIFEGKWMSC